MNPTKAWAFFINIPRYHLNDATYAKHSFTSQKEKIISKQFIEYFKKHVINNFGPKSNLLNPPDQRPPFESTNP